MPQHLTAKNLNLLVRVVFQQIYEDLVGFNHIKEQRAKSKEHSR